MLLSSKHVDGEDQFRSQDSFDKDALRNTGASRESRPHVEVLREQVANEHRSEDTAYHLRKKQADGAYEGDGTDEEKREGDCWVEQATADTEEDLKSVSGDKVGWWKISCSLPKH